MIGKMIAQYRIVEALGKGGMGTVYKAQDTQLNRTVVLKLLSQNLLGNDKARSRFLREARLASALDHPNICTIYEIQETGGYYYIAMQYIEGQTLKQAINRRPLSNSTFLSIALQVADALASAHDRGVIHRDIKPQNIMITPRGQAKVLDFGLAKNINESSGAASGAMVSGDLTDQGKTLGTPSYMSPEQ
ncbi:MAG TPA: serine/threonine-protein kinase, partial [Acidobacteriota bacterium]|nr:serine/threonine-protein kinase [Acidobacteriota bacterium]